MNVVMELATASQYALRAILAEGTPEEISRTPGCWRSISRHERCSDSAEPLVRSRTCTPITAEPHPARRLAHGRRREVVGLLGRNGVGKSTTLKTIMGLVQPSHGTVLLDGNAITGLPSHKLARSASATCRRPPHLPPAHGHGEPAHRVRPPRRHEDRRRTLLDKAFTISRSWPSAAARPADALGRRAANARHRPRHDAGPKIILLDEPTEGLMPRMVSQIRQIIDVLHNEGVASSWSSRTCR